MELNNYKLMKIPFVSKKKSFEILGVGPTSKYSFSGFAYYLVDTNNWCIVWERAIFTEAEYRKTDSAMLVTDHYKAYYGNVDFDREEVLGFSDIKGQVAIANQEQIDLINEFSLHHTKTVLKLEGVITGSNPTGSDSTISASPIHIDPRSELDYVRFINAIKRIRCIDKTFDKALKEVLHNVSDIERVFTNQITIDDLMVRNETFGKWMKIFNSDIDEFMEEDSGLMEYINEINQKEIRNSIQHLISMYDHNLIEETKLITKLRREFRVALLKEAIENGYTEYTGDNELSIYDTEAAHILGVSEIKQNDLDLEWIADPNNGLLLSPKLHTILDKHKIFLNEDGTFISNSDEYENISNYKIHDDILNNERREFIKLRNKYL